MVMINLTREQLEERLAALHRASLELVRDTSLDSLLARIATVACQQAGARYAAVGVLGENRKLERFINIGMTAEEISLMDHPPVGAGLIGALMNSTVPIRLPRIQDDPRSVGFPEHHPPMASFLGVPIRQGERQLGQIYLTEKIGASEFSPEDQQVIETLAAYAAIAISNARLYRNLTERDRLITRRNENLALLNDLAVTLASSSDTDQILDKAINQVIDYLKVEVGEVFLREEEGNTLRLVLHLGEATSLWNQSEYRLGFGAIGLTAKSGQPLLINLPDSTEHDLHTTLEENGFRQIACFPLTGRRGVLGVLCVATRHPHPFDDLEMQFLNAISSWVATEIENVRLNMQQRRLAILEERERIGMDLHDGIIQSIYAVGLTLEHARLLLKDAPDQSNQRMEQAMADLNSTIRDIRAYILDLRPRQLHEEDLMQGLPRLVKEFHANTLVETTLEGPPVGTLKLSDKKAIALFHICQEGLANIAKHARAHKVDIVVWTTPDRVLLEVSDDGRGFDVNKMRLTLGHGLSNMQTRAHNVGGEVEFDSTPNEGTTILAWVPNSE